MRNVIAIAQKELKSYFSSPIAYIAIGFFAFLYGYFYVAILQYFVRQSMQMNQFQGGPQALNINQVLIRQLLQNVTILILFIMPMVTMRTYSEEKRSGTIELLLTSPLTDFQIILGKFLGALALWATMLAVSLIHIGLLFVYGNPEWKPIATAYLGLLLLEPDEKSDRGGHGHLRGVPVSLGHHLDRQLLGSDHRRPDAVPVDHRPLRRFRKRCTRHDASHLLRQLHYIRAVPDRQVGGQRTLARVAKAEAGHYVRRRRAHSMAEARH
jgi:hypothetical protein